MILLYTTNQLWNTTSTMHKYDYDWQLIENQFAARGNHSRSVSTPPRFIVGMEFLRNKDDTLLEANWEFATTCTMVVRAKYNTRGRYWHNSKKQDHGNYPYMHYGPLDRTVSTRRGMFNQYEYYSQIAKKTMHDHHKKIHEKLKSNNSYHHTLDENGKSIIIDRRTYQKV